jgi:hypothetical protein
MDTTHPVIASAHSSFLLPITRIKVNASCSAAPETSRIPPIITPSPIMIPVLFNVFPNPSLIAVITPTVVSPAAFVISATGMPPIKPVINAASNNAINVCTFVFITRTIIIAIPITSPSIILVDSLIVLTSLNSFSQQMYQKSSRNILRLHCDHLFHFRLP